MYVIQRVRTERKYAVWSESGKFRKLRFKLFIATIAAIYYLDSHLLDIFNANLLSITAPSVSESHLQLCPKALLPH